MARVAGRWHRCEIMTIFYPSPADAATRRLLAADDDVIVCINVCVYAAVTRAR
jgi:hypothetical protein